jgi:hypothetical protein
VTQRCYSTLISWRCLVQILTGTPASPSRQCQDSNSIRPRTLPSKSSSIHHSSIILPFKDTQFGIWQVIKRTTEVKDRCKDTARTSTFSSIGNPSDR